ncbi:MAG: aminopeptidase N [Propionibacteriaceae bacterium]|nr:aminopeptidase N [Propionibacteriaceae bacterium]
MNLTRTEAAGRAKLIANPRYRIELDLRGDAPRFHSRTVINFEASQVGASSFIDLIAPEVLSIRLNGRDLDPAQVFSDDRIQLDDLAEHNELAIEARCAYSHTGEGLHRFTDPADGQTYLYTQFEPADARRVFAVFEQPDLKGVFELTVTAPAGWTVVANQPVAAAEPVAEPGAEPGAETVAEPGAETVAEPATETVAEPGAKTVAEPATEPAAETVAETVEETATELKAASGQVADGIVHRFEPTPKLSSYLVALIAGPYQQWRADVVSSSGRTVPLALYARASMAQYVDAENIFAITRQGFGFYEPAFGQPYPFAKYDQVFCPEYNFGAMENAGLVTITESYVFRSKPVQSRVERRAITILHELAHMWFGDLVTMRWWNDLWLNESFAEFVSHLAAVAATDWKGAWTTFAYTEKTWAYKQDQLPTTHPILATINDLDDVHNNFDGITYAKGASVLRGLVAWVGQDAFLAGVRSYFAKHAWSNTTLNDLLVELEAASGRDLDTWAEAWLKTAGVNTIWIDSAAGHMLQRGQAPHPAWRPQRVALGGYSLVDGVPTRFWDTEVDLTGPATALPKLRPADLLLVNDRDLAYAKIRLDPGSLEVASTQVAELTDPLARSVVWGILWDMARDGELGARVFVDRVLDGVGRETNSTAMRQLLDEVAAALGSFVATEFRGTAVADAADRLWALALSAESGSDAQLQLVKAFALHAWTPSALDLVEELVKGSRSLTGLSLDVDLAWELLGALAAGGRIGQDRIDQQLEADHTLSGLEQAARLQAAIPTPEAKAAAWLRAVEDPTTPNATQRAIIAGWGRVGDRALLVPFVEPYFAALPRIWRDRSPETAAAIAEGLYPRLVADQPGQDVLGATDRFLAGPGGSIPPLRRLVEEGRAGVVRALNAQTKDREA